MNLNHRIKERYDFRIAGSGVLVAQNVISNDALSWNIDTTNCIVQRVLSAYGKQIRKFVTSTSHLNKFGSNFYLQKCTDIAQKWDKVSISIQDIQISGPRAITTFPKKPSVRKSIFSGIVQPAAPKSTPPAHYEENLINHLTQNS